MEDAANGIPLKQCRGIEHTDLNDSLFLVQAPIEHVAQAFSPFPQLVLWQRDVYEREIEILGYGLMVFQFRGHPWTLIHQLNFMPYQSPLQIPFRDEDMESLSKLLHTKAICYQISDTSHTIGYHLYDCGESIEELYAEGENCQFQSRLRQLKAEDIGNPYFFTDNFFREQDVYVPAFAWNIFSFRVGQRITLGIKGFEYDNFERMDYAVLN